MNQSRQKRILLILSSIIISVYCQNLPQGQAPPAFTLRQDVVNVQKLNNIWKIQFICQAHVGQCKIAYIFLPLGWSSQDSKIIVPIEDIERVAAFALQANVSQPTGQYALVDIQIDFEDQQIALRMDIIEGSSSLLQWRNTSFSSISRPTINTINIENSVSSSSSSSSLQPSSKDIQNQKLEESENINENEEIKVTGLPINEFGQTFLQANNIIDSMPSIEKIQTIIAEGDIAQVAMNIQNAIQFDMQCSQKLPLLRDIENNVEEAIKNNKENISEQNLKLIDQNQRLQNLTFERQSIERQLDITGTKEQIQREIRFLEYEKSKTFSDFYNYARIKEVYNTRLRSAVSIAGITPDQLRDLKELVDQDDQKLKQIDEEIKKLLIQKTFVERRKQSNQNKIREVERNGGGVDQAKILSLEQKFRQYSEMSKRSEQAYFKAEEDLAKARQKYASSQQEIIKLTERLDQINKIIQQAEQNFQTQQKIENEARIKALERNLPGLKDSIQQCQSSLGIQVFIQEPIVTLPPVQPIDILQLRIDNRINQQINFFSADWIMKYGVPQPFRFSCSNLLSPTKDYGQIVRIKGTIMRVMDLDDGSQYDLHIGLCSRISAKTSIYIPKPGDIVDWQGKAESDFVYNINRANIYQR